MVQQVCWQFNFRSGACEAANVSKMDGKSFNKDGPLYFEQSEDEGYDQFEVTPLVHPNSAVRAEEKSFGSQISSESSLRNNNEAHHNIGLDNDDDNAGETKFWPASSQISFSRPDPGMASLYDSALFSAAAFKDGNGSGAATHKGYLEHLREQALGPQAVLKGLKVDAYLQMPKKSETPTSVNVFCYRFGLISCRKIRCEPYLEMALFYRLTRNPNSSISKKIPSSSTHS